VTGLAADTSRWAGATAGAETNSIAAAAKAGNPYARTIRWAGFIVDLVEDPEFPPWDLHHVVPKRTPYGATFDCATAAQSGSFVRETRPLEFFDADLDCCFCTRTSAEDYTEPKHRSLRRRRRHYRRARRRRAR
jgi:hypothetical protein